MDIYCQAFTHKGKSCDGIVSSNGLCKLHNNAREYHGPNTFALKQLENRHKGEMEKLKTELAIGLLPLKEYHSKMKIAIGQFESRKQMVMDDQAENVAWSGVDPDAASKEKKRIRREKFDFRREELRRIRLEALQRQREAMRYAYVYAVDDVAPRELRDFVTDPQNVHTTEAVKQTKEIVEKVRQIPVPEEYRWNPETCSKTPGEIIAECKLSQQAALQMMTQYSLDTAIYDIEPGIYGKVLDSVWQYVKESPDEMDLCSILKQEMEDNIGMCAQGNLTRICNILAGYLNGVGSVESLSEKLGRLLAPLMDLDSVWERRKVARDILMENEVPHDQWETWMEPLMA